jgi:hypothetical protein
VRMPRLVTRSDRFLVGPLLLAGAAAGVAAGVAPVTPAAARASFTGPAASFTISGQLSGVAATSARSAWAVGFSGSNLSPRTLIVRWNGTAWKRLPSPSPAGSVLSGVAATSAGSAWAVGSTGSGKSLILRWNGTAWRRVPSPSPGANAVLSGVVATSARSAWAVGSTGSRTLILRWNGTAWRRLPSPSPGASAILSAVAATSAGSAWAVGSTGILPKTLIERWNGTAWKRVPSPSPAFSERLLRGVAAVSARSAWAVGCSTCATASGFNRTLIERWTGTAWKSVLSPSPTGGILSGVAATSARSAWAVGGTERGTGIGARIGTLILRWNGKTWRRVPSPSPGRRAGLSSVAVTSARSAWAVGTSGGKTLILRWNGTAWK